MRRRRPALGEALVGDGCAARFPAIVPAFVRLEARGLRSLPLAAGAAWLCGDLLAALGGAYH